MKTETIAVMNRRKQDSAVRHQHATGVLLFGSTGQLLFMNYEAQTYIRQLQSFTAKENGTCLIPGDIHAVVRELITKLMHCNHPKDCETIQIERICFGMEPRLLLRGFCVPDEPLMQNSRLLIIMEKLNQKLAYPDAIIKQRYHLTEREQMVIIYLMLGFTNKEIANRLNLSEYTVKEHLKRIMQKTKTTTRTGLLARMIFPSSQGVIPEYHQVDMH
jgi:DNA-binding CsgD family transcriptional regulator